MGSHRHKCDSCGFVWEHADSNAGKTAPHTCVCGKEVWYRHYGDEKPDYIGCGRPVRMVIEAVKKTVKRTTRVVRNVCKVIVTRRPQARRQKVAA